VVDSGVDVVPAAPAVVVVLVVPLPVLLAEVVGAVVELVDVLPEAGGSAYALELVDFPEPTVR
jgi:hypothetical protein